ncbi:hypothetical protein AAVH_14088 [Aphelenchoides avenae]|nr:hypothetical protein AAVH_14088 [Aphelenchus avenae]
MPSAADIDTGTDPGLTIQAATTTSNGTAPAVNQVHDSLLQHTERLRDMLESKDAELEDQLKRVQISSGIISNLRDKLLAQSTIFASRRG